MEQNEKRKIMPHCLSVNNCVPQEMEINNVRLAAAYVPYQYLCTLLSPLEALKKGTAFPELFSPYEGKEKKCMPMPRISGEKPMKEEMDKMELLKQISAVEFMKEDLSLYLNTHPMDKEAIKIYNCYVVECKRLLGIYEMNFGMLCENNSVSPYPWQWVTEPWPWDKEANFEFEEGEV